MEERLDKKVLFLASWFPSKENPSLGNFVLKHAEIASSIAEVDVLYAVASHSVEEATLVEEEVNNVHTLLVYYPPIKSNIPFVASLLKRAAYQKALKKGFNHLNKNYDWVHLNAVFPAGIFARWIKKKHGTPYIATVHWTGFLPQQHAFKRLPYFIRRVYRAIFKDASKVLPVSAHLGKSLQELGLVNEYEVLNNVVNEKYFYPAKKNQEKNSPTRFLHISTFNDAHKNVSGMLSAFSQLKKDFLLHLVTEGEEEEVWSLVDQYKIPRSKCIVESKLRVDQIGNAMRLADCFVLFSNYETFSVVLAEAWTSGVPAIYSRCGGLTEINNPIIGKQIEPKNEKVLLEALEKFSETTYNPHLIVKFSERFSSENVKNKIVKVYL